MYLLYSFSLVILCPTRAPVPVTHQLTIIVPHACPCLRLNPPPISIIVITTIWPICLFIYPFVSHHAVWPFSTPHSKARFRPGYILSGSCPIMIDIWRASCNDVNAETTFRSLQSNGNIVEQTDHSFIAPSSRHHHCVHHIRVLEPKPRGPSESAAFEATVAGRAVDSPATLCGS